LNTSAQDWAISSRTFSGYRRLGSCATHDSLYGGISNAASGIRGLQRPGELERSSSIMELFCSARTQGAQRLIALQSTCCFAPTHPTIHHRRLAARAQLPMLILDDCTHIYLQIQALHQLVHNFGMYECSQGHSGMNMSLSTRISTTLALPVPRSFSCCCSGHLGCYSNNSLPKFLEMTGPSHECHSFASVVSS
jgi:hypothetical protein